MGNEFRLISAVVEQALAAGDDKTRVPPLAQDGIKRLENAYRILPRFDAADAQEHRPVAKIEPPAEPRLRSVDRRRIAGQIDAIAANFRFDAKCLRELAAPMRADDEKCVGGADRIRLEAGDALVAKSVDVVNGADMSRDQAFVAQPRERVAGDAIMRVIEIETPILWPAEPFHIVCDALLDHRECVARRRQDGEGDRAARR